jgi:hypothetical protein
MDIHDKEWSIVHHTFFFMVDFFNDKPYNLFYHDASTSIANKKRLVWFKNAATQRLTTAKQLINDEPAQMSFRNAYFNQSTEPFNQLIEKLEEYLTRSTSLLDEDLLVQPRASSPLNQRMVELIEEIRKWINLEFLQTGGIMSTQELVQNSLVSKEELPDPPVSWRKKRNNESRACVEHHTIFCLFVKQLEPIFLSFRSP